MVADILSKLGLLVFALGVSAFSQSAEAKTAESWRADLSNERCDIRYYRAEMMVFMIRYLRDGSYSLSGEALRIPETGEDVQGDIRVLAGEQSILLNGSFEALQQQTQESNSHPIKLFIDSVEDRTTFTLITEEGSTEFGVDGFAKAADEFTVCSRDMFLTQGPREPMLIEFDGIHKLAAVAARQRLLSHKLSFTLAIDEAGKPTGCKFSRKFRRRAVENSLCKPLLRHMTFEPAIDEDGTPVAGTYSSEIDFQMWMMENGNLDPRAR